MSFFSSLLHARRAWFHAWRIDGDLQRECTVCGQRERRDADGDLMCNGPGAWWVARSGRPTAHLRQLLSRRAAEPSIAASTSCESMPADEIVS